MEKLHQCFSSKESCNHKAEPMYVFLETVMDSEKTFPFKDQETEIIETDLVISLEIMGIIVTAQLNLNWSWC